ncbi:MAG TPA: hypothetical protein PLO63_07340 [Syntrophales bacterium]|jgi:hypothetical protein|nr:hypothetical protein [Syntrophales bacterium]
MIKKSILKGEMDRRIIEQKLRNGDVTEEELAKALAQLPDAAEKADYVKIRRDEKRKPGGGTISHAD